MKNVISILVVFIFFTFGCSSNKDLKKAEKQERQIENSLEAQAHHLAKKLEGENYEVAGLGDMEWEILAYLRAKQKSGSISEEAIVTAPTDNIGKTKCLVNIKSRVARMVCDSIRYRVDESTGADEANKEYVDKFFSASEHLGILNLGAPDYSFTIVKRMSKSMVQYRMFAVYSPETVNDVVKNGVRFGNDIKAYIDKGLNK